MINGNGELIGIAFDGNWEAMSGDIAFEPELQRTISVDIRYVLFIIDKYAGAKNLIDEMTIVSQRITPRFKRSRSERSKTNGKHRLTITFLGLINQKREIPANSLFFHSTSSL